MVKLHDFSSLVVQISRFCTNSAKFCAVARLHDGNIQNLCTWVLCIAGQRITIYYRISQLIKCDVTNNSKNSFISSTLPSISVSFTHRGGEHFCDRKILDEFEETISLLTLVTPRYIPKNYIITFFCFPLCLPVSVAFTHRKLS